MFFGFREGEGSRKRVVMRCLYVIYMGKKHANLISVRRWFVKESSSVSYFCGGRGFSKGLGD